MNTAPPLNLADLAIPDLAAERATYFFADGPLPEDFDEFANEISVANPLPGDWAALTACLGRPPTDAELDAFRAEFRAALMDIIAG